MLSFDNQVTLSLVQGHKRIEVRRVQMHRQWQDPKQFLLDQNGNLDPREDPTDPIPKISRISENGLSYRGTDTTK